ncbi:hypothetical protein [Halostella salina]|uniref:hypothetical protein n=1 Tax=Halostella salina TaxID=1547897 RepID=UPI000EF7D1AD|nr:hypothetical protein [Halostella salina]
MTRVSRYRNRLDNGWDQVVATVRPYGRRVFRDYRGLFVFLLTCTAAMLLWRTTFSINDNLTVANGLVALSDGRLHVVKATYGNTLVTPGMAELDGRAYPRNFAHIVVALPVLWAFDLVAAVADVRIALAALWSLSLFATVSVGGRLVGRHRTVHLLGGALALATFAASVATATPFPYEHLAYPALQFATVLAAAACALVVYRLLAHAHSTDIGLAAGVAAGVASPALLWATIPKRHVLTALFALLTLYCLYWSRTADNDSTYRRYRAVAYVPVGLTAWLNASEGLVLFVALVVADFVTARDNSIRTVAIVSVGFLLSLIPFLLTNYLLSGDPFAPPRMLDRYGGEAVGGTVTEEIPGASEGSGDTGSQSGDGLLDGIRTGVLSPVFSILDRAMLFVTFLEYGVTASIQEPQRLYHTFVRSGYFDFSSRGATGLAINVAFLEALPIAGALVAAPFVVGRSLYRRLSASVPLEFRSRPTATADIFAVVYVILIMLLYIHRLPLYSMLTVRFIYPLFPLAVYGVARLPAVRTTVAEWGTWLSLTYAGSVFIGGQLAVLGVALANYTADEAIQGLALLGLVVASGIAVWSLLGAFDRVDGRAGAVLLGVGSGLATVLMITFAVSFFGPTADFALPIVP